jgi:hypothetical protein
VLVHEDQDRDEMKILAFQVDSRRGQGAVATNVPCPSSGSYNPVRPDLDLHCYGTFRLQP